MLLDWLKHTNFAYPWFLPLLSAIPYMIFWYIKDVKKQTAAFKITTTHFLPSGIGSRRAKFRHVPFVLRCLCLAAFITALARPQQKFQ
jgi:Ca-activated chloride channel family protein